LRPHTGISLTNDGWIEATLTMIGQPQALWPDSASWERRNASND